MNIIERSLSKKSPHIPYIKYQGSRKITLKSPISHTFRDLRFVEHKNGWHYDVQLDETYEVAILVRCIYVSVSYISYIISENHILAHFSINLVRRVGYVKYGSEYGKNHLERWWIGVNNKHSKSLR